jgi:hypothetical protein
VSALRAAALGLALASHASAAPPGWLEHADQLRKGAHVDGVWCSERVGPAISYSDVRLGAVDASATPDRAAAERWLRSQLRPEAGDVLLRFPRAGLGTRLEVRMTPLAETGGYAVEAKLRDFGGALLCELAQSAAPGGGEALGRALRGELVEKLGQGLPLP